MSKVDWNTKGGRLRRERIAAALSANALNAHELAAALAMTRKWAGENIVCLHRAGEIHIEAWRPWHSNTHPVPCYRWGSGEDAPRPAYDHATKKKRDWKARMSDPAQYEAYLARRRARRAAVPPEERNAQFKQWRKDNPERYKEHLKRSIATRSAKRAKLRAEKAEKARTESADAKLQAYNLAMRNARRHAKTIADADERRRYLELQQILNRPPQPDPLVGLFFGTRT